MKACKANIARARAFFEFFDQVDDNGQRKRGRGQPKNKDKELLRGSLVFAVGALDAYLHDLILEIDPTRAPHSKQLDSAMKAIAKNEPGLALRVAIAPSNDRVAEFRAALERWLENQSFQGPEKVMTALGLVGCPLDWPDFDKTTGVDTADDLKQATDLRHNIVHRASQTSLTRDRAESVTTLIESIAQRIDQDIMDRYR